jgi:hypothetical protein
MLALVAVVPSLVILGCGDDGEKPGRRFDDGSPGGDLITLQMEQSQLTCGCLEEAGLIQFCTDSAWPAGYASCARDVFNRRAPQNQEAFACARSAIQEHIDCMRAAACDSDALGACNHMFNQAQPACTQFDQDTRDEGLACRSGAGQGDGDGDASPGGDPHASFFGIAPVTGTLSERRFSGIVSHFATADFDEDGIADLMVGQGFADPGEDRAVLLSSKGGFDAEPSFLSCEESSCDYPPAIGDVNGDGHLDVVEAFFNAKDGPHEDSRISVHLGDGAGGFSQPVLTVIPFLAAFDIALSDADSDGSAELVVQATRSVECHEQLKTRIAGGLGACKTDADCGDGNICYPSLIFKDYNSYCVAPCEHLAQYGADAGGTFREMWRKQVGSIDGIASAGDLDADGDLDALLPGSGGLLRNRAGTLEHESSSLMHANDLIDLDGDGQVDLLYTKEVKFLDDGMTSTSIPLLPEVSSSISVGTLGDKRVFSQSFDTSSDPAQVVAYEIQDRKPVYLMRLALDATALDDGYLKAAAISDFDGDGTLEAVYSPNSSFTVTRLVPAR